MLSPIQRVSLFSDKIAITDTSCQYTYQTLLDNSKKNCSKSIVSNL